MKENNPENKQNKFVNNASVVEGMNNPIPSAHAAIVQPPIFQFKPVSTLPDLEEEPKEKDKKEEVSQFKFTTGGIPPPDEVRDSTAYQFQSASDTILPSLPTNNNNTSSDRLPPFIQNKMEGIFQKNFSDVNIHKDSLQARNLGALAFTQGTHIHFAPGQFEFNSPKGQELIGHELAHVVQQGEERVNPTGKSIEGYAINEDETLEKEADDMGRKVTEFQFDNINDPNQALQNDSLKPFVPGKKNKEFDTKSSIVISNGNVSDKIQKEGTPSEGNNKTVSLEKQVPQEVVIEDENATNENLEERGIEETESSDVGITTKENKLENNKNNKIELSKTRTPQINNAGLKQWSQNITKDISNVPNPDLTEIEKAPEELYEEGQQIEETRINQTPDYTESIEISVSSMPEMENEPETDVNSIEYQTESIVTPFQNRLLPEQQMPALIPTPSGIMPRLGDSVELAILENKIQELEDEIGNEKGYSSDEMQSSSEISDNEQKLHDLREKAAQLLPDNVIDGKESPLSIKDEGEPPKPELSEDMQSNTGDVIARLLVNPKGEAKDILRQIRRSTFPTPILDSLYPNIGEEELPGLTDVLKSELEDIAKEAGLSEEQLQGKIAEQTQIVKEKEQALSLNVGQMFLIAQEKLQEQGSKETAKIAGLKDIKEKKIQDQKDAANGGADTKIIRKRAKEIRLGISKNEGQQNAYYDKARARRITQINKSKSQYVQAYSAATFREKQKLSKSTKEEVNPLQLAAIEIWNDGVMRELDNAMIQLKDQSNQTVSDYKNSIRKASGEALAKLEEWETEKVGSQKSWWQKLLDTIQSWVTTAQGEAEVWEQVNIQKSQEALVGNINLLSNAKQQLGDNISNETLKSFKGLNEEQRVVLETYYSGGSKDGIAAVAEGLKVQIKNQHRDQIERKLKKALLAKPPSDWQKLNNIVKSMNPAFDAKYICTELRGAMRGVGTTEDRFYNALSGFNEFEGQIIRICYKGCYPGRDLDEDIDSEFGGAEFDRAEALLKGDSSTADAAAIKEALRGWNDEDAVMKVLRGKSAEERQRIAQVYKEKYGKDLDAHLNGELEGRDLERAEALMEGDVDKADAIGLDEAINGRGLFKWGADKAEAEAIYSERKGEVEAQVEQKKQQVMNNARKYGWSLTKLNEELRKEGCTSEQIKEKVLKGNQKLEAKYNEGYGHKYETEEGQSALRVAFGNEFSDGELDFVNALADNDEKKQDVAKITMEMESFSVNDDVVNGVLENQYDKALRDKRQDEWPAIQIEVERLAEEKGWDDYQLAEELRRREEKLELSAIELSKKNMNELTDTYEKEKGEKGAFRKDILGNVHNDIMGADKDKARDLLDGGGYLNPVQQLEYATRGAGTKEKVIEGLFKGKTKEEIEKIKKDWKEKHGTELMAEMKSELSGRDEFDTEMWMRGLPKTREDDMKNLNDRYNWEKSALIEGEEMEALQRDMEFLRKQNDILNNPGAYTEDELAVAEAFFKQGANNVDIGIGASRAEADALANTVAMVAGITASLLVTALTAGTAGPFVIAIYASLAGTGATMLSKQMILGNAYGAEDILLDGGVGLVDVLSAGVFSKLNLGKAGNVIASKLVKDPKVNRLLSRVIKEGMEELVSSAPAAVTGNVFNDENWENGNPFLNIVKGAGLEMGLSMGVGMGVGGFGALKNFDVNVGRTEFEISPYKSTKNRPEVEPLIGQKLTDVDLPEGYLQYTKKNGDVIIKRKNGNGVDAEFTPLRVDGEGRIEIGGKHKSQTSVSIKETNGIPSNSTFGNTKNWGEVKSLLGKHADDVDLPDGYSKYVNSKGTIVIRRPKADDAQFVPLSTDKKGNIVLGKPSTKKIAGQSQSDSSLDLGEGKTGLKQADSQLKNALPSQFKDTPIYIDPSLPGNTVKVHYNLEGNGLVKGVFVRVGKSTSSVDIELHANTIKLMHNYSGLKGRVRILIDRFRRFAKLNGSPPVGSKAWEAQLELEKLPRIIQNRMNQLQKIDLDADTRATLEIDVINLETQFSGYRRTLDEMDFSKGRGYVAAEGVDKDVPSGLATDFENNESLRSFIKNAPDPNVRARRIEAWGSLFDSPDLRKITTNLIKIDNYVSNFGKSFGDIKTELANIPKAQRQGWINHLEYRTNGNLVNKTSDKANLYNSFTSDTDVPSRYGSDNRFDTLASDPSHAGAVTSKTRQEAMAGLEAEKQGLLPSPISREPIGDMEFYDGDGFGWDVKAPRGDFFNENSVGNSIKKELRDKPTDGSYPKGTHPNNLTGKDEPRRIILDCSYINDLQLQTLRNWLSDNLTADELSRIVEVNVNLN